MSAWDKVGKELQDELVGAHMEDWVEGVQDATEAMKAALEAGVEKTKDTPFHSGMMLALTVATAAAEELKQLKP